MDSFVPGARTSSADPSDPGLKDPSVGAQSTGYRCSICEVYVRPRSKHCRVCNRCTEDFDHHCMWLNNCVGRANYPYFFALLCSTLLLTTMHFGVSLYLFIQSFAHRPLIQPLQQSRYHGHISMNGLRVVWSLTVGTAAILEGLLLDLLSFHLVLQGKGMSTYDYILAQREAQETIMDAQHHASFKQQLQQKVSCFHVGRKARVTPSEISLEALADLPEKPKKKLKVRLNPVTAWRVNSKRSNPPVAKARFSSMAEYIMPSMFAGKVPAASAVAQQQNEATALPSAVSEQPSARENPTFDVEAQQPSPSQPSTFSRLPLLLGPSTAWSPSATGSTNTTSQAAWAETDSLAMPMRPQLSIDNALFVQPLLSAP
ncbi:TPA: hypothetical protein ACH3X1_002449 [Trebouxia sp. C0004]